VDSSITPHRVHDFANGIRCDYWGAPVWPYHPSAEDPTRTDGLRILEVPVSTFIPGVMRLPLRLQRRLGRFLTYRKRIGRLLGLDFTRYWIRPFRGSPADLVLWVDKLTASWPRSKAVVINVMFHSVELIPGASPYAANKQDVAILLESLEALFSHVFSRYRAEAVTLSELYSRWHS
jgi:hypothetical protein